MDEPIAIVLAAGKGTRMRSDLPKVLVPVCGRPMIEYVIDALQEGGVGRIVVVVGYRGEDVRRALAGRDTVCFVEQAQQLGTGHAVMMCRSELEGHDGAVLVVTGDSPMLQASSVRRLIEWRQKDRSACVLGTAIKDDPGGLGRVIRGANGEFDRIVEAKDATPEQLAVKESNMSTYIFGGPELLWALGKINNNNSQREYYITDCPGVLKRAGKPVEAADVLRPCEALSVNTVEDLAEVEREMRRMQS